MHAGHLIREARRQAGLTQAELAKKLKTAQPNVARWESAAISPTVDNLIRVLAACDCDLLIRMLPRSEGQWQPLDDTAIDLTADERLDKFVTFVDTLDETKHEHPSVSNG